MPTAKCNHPVGHSLLRRCQVSLVAQPHSNSKRKATSKSLSGVGFYPHSPLRQSSTLPRVGVATRAIRRFSILFESIRTTATTAIPKHRNEKDEEETARTDSSAYDATPKKEMREGQPTLRGIPKRRMEQE